MVFRRPLWLLPVVVVGHLAWCDAAWGAGTGSCERAGLWAEQAHGIPPGLLLAIGRAESGRRDPITGQVAPWPWTINVEGTGRQFESAAEAVVRTEILLLQGIQSIDVGCFQISLLHHPTAFLTMDDAFNPTLNAAYAARFLVGLRARTGSWDDAIAAYHSADPERGQLYRDRVLGRTPSVPRPAGAGAVAAIPPAAIPPGTWPQAATATAPRGWSGCASPGSNNRAEGLRRC